MDRKRFEQRKFQRLRHLQRVEPERGLRREERFHLRNADEIARSLSQQRQLDQHDCGNEISLVRYPLAATAEQQTVPASCARQVPDERMRIDAGRITSASPFARRTPSSDENPPTKLNELIEIGRFELSKHPHRPATLRRAGAPRLHLVAEQLDDRRRHGASLSAYLVLQGGEELGIDPDRHHGAGGHVLHRNTIRPFVRFAPQRQGLHRRAARILDHRKAQHRRSSCVDRVSS